MNPKNTKVNSRRSEPSLGRRPSVAASGQRGDPNKMPSDIDKIYDKGALSVLIYLPEAVLEPTTSYPGGLS